MSITAGGTTARSGARKRRDRVIGAILLVLVGAAIGRANSPTPGPAAAAVVSPTAMLKSLKLVSYYPSNAAWTYMWQSWNPTQMDHDFATLASMSANAVRIEIQPSAVGSPVPTPAMQSEINQAIAMAAAHGLKVQLTLFNWWGSYTAITDSDKWATAVLGGLKDDPRIAFIELQNEIKPEDPLAMAWANHEIPVVRQAAGSIPLTLSVTDDAEFTALQELQTLKAALVSTPIDFYDVHLYTTTGTIYAAMAAAQAAVAPAPLYIGEVGMSTISSGAPGSQALAEAEQDQYFRTVEWAARSLGLPAPGPWTFQDFTAAGVPPQGSLPPSGYYFGLLRVDGSMKPAGSSLAAFYGTGAISTDFNNGFESGAGGLPANWQVYYADQGTLAWDPTVSHTGQASVRLSNTAGDTSGTPSFHTTPIISPTQSGQQFEATVWAKGSASTGNNVIAVTWFDANNFYIGESDSLPLPSGTSKWTQLSTVATAPPNAAYAQIYVKSGNNTGTVWFDDVTFDPYSITLDNAGFEQTTAGQPSAWSIYRPGQATFGYDTTVSHGGKASVSISNATGDSTGVPAFFALPTISPIHVGEQFAATVWAKGFLATGSSRLAVSWFDATNTYLGQSESASIASGTTDWARLMVITSVPIGATYARVDVKSANNTGTVWFDDVTLSPYVITVYNTGFEEGAGSSPSGWSVYRPAQGTFTWDTSVSHGGMASVSITNATGDRTGTPSFITTPIITPLEAGDQFQASVWAKGSAASGVSNVAVSWFDASNHYLSATSSTGLLSGTTDWQQLAVVATVPANASYAQIDLQSAANTGTVWFDDVTFTPFTLQIFNPGFEEGSGSVAAGWQLSRANQGTLAWDNSVSHSGTSSVSLSNTTGDGSGTPSFFTTPTMTTLHAGQQFQASVWARGSAATGSNLIAVAWFDASNKYLGESDSPGLLSGTTAWSQLSVVATAPAPAMSARIYVKSASDTGTVWFDDVSLTPYALTTYNTSLEQGSGLMPAGWGTYMPSEGTFAWDTSVAHTGAKSVKLSNTTGDNTGIPSYFTTVTINPLQAGQQFQASAWTMGSAETGTAAVAVSWYGAANAYLGANVSTPVLSGTTGWTQLSVVATAPAGAVYAQIHLRSANNTGSVWFDDVAFVTYALTVNNPGFSQGAGTTPVAWQQGNASLATLAWDPSVTHSSGGSVRIDASGGTLAKPPAFTTVPVISPLNAGQQFQVAAWAKGSAATGTNTLAVTWFNYGGTVVATTTSAPLASGTTSWAQLSVVATVPASAVSAQIALQSSSNSGTVWFDDITMVPYTLMTANPGFEAGAGQTPTGWQQYHPTQGSFAWDTGVSHSGGASVSLTATTGDLSGVPSFITTPVINPLQAGQQYQIGVWARGTATTGNNNLVVSWFNAANAYLGGTSSAALPNGTTTWTQLSMTTTVPDGAAYVQIFVRSGSNSGTVWYDDVTFAPLTLTVYNADFEQGAGNNPAGWQFSDSDDDDWTNSVAHSGSSSVRISSTTDNGPGGASIFTRPVIGPLQAGQQFQIGVWAEGPSSTGTNNVAVTWFNSTGAVLATSTSPSLPTGASTWTQLNDVTTVPAGAAYAQIALQSADNSGTVYFDDVTFIPFTLITANSGFEQGAGSSPAGWLQYKPTMGSFGWDTGVSRSGQASVTLWATGGDSSGTPAWKVVPTINPMHASEQFHLSVWAQGAGLTGSTTMAISWFNSKGAYISGASSPALAIGTTGWTQLSLDTTAPSGAVTAMIYLQSAKNTGQVWFDDVEMSATN